jgi:hypothetical protein
MGIVAVSSCKQDHNDLSPEGYKWSYFYPLKKDKYRVRACAIQQKRTDNITFWCLVYQWFARRNTQNTVLRRYSASQWSCFPTDEEQCHAFDLHGNVDGSINTFGSGIRTKDLRFPRRWLWRMVSSGLLRRVALVRTDVSKEPGASFIRVTKSVN